MTENTEIPVEEIKKQIKQDIIMIVTTNALWLIWIFIREMRRYH